MMLTSDGSRTDTQLQKKGRDGVSSSSGGAALSTGEKQLVRCSGTDAPDHGDVGIDWHVGGKQAPRGR
jgi:hypothetical protein